MPISSNFSFCAASSAFCIFSGFALLSMVSPPFTIGFSAVFALFPEAFTLSPAVFALSPAVFALPPAVFALPDVFAVNKPPKVSSATFSASSTISFSLVTAASSLMPFSFEKSISTFLFLSSFSLFSMASSTIFRYCLFFILLFKGIMPFSFLRNILSVSCARVPSSGFFKLIF